MLGCKPHSDQERYNSFHAFHCIALSLLLLLNPNGIPYNIHIFYVRVRARLSPT